MRTDPRLLLVRRQRFRGVTDDTALARVCRRRVVGLGELDRLVCLAVDLRDEEAEVVREIAEVGFLFRYSR